MAGFRCSKAFTTIELVLAMAAACVLFLAVAIFLCYDYSCWRVNSSMLELQRDLTLAMYRFNRVVRGACANDVVQPLPGLPADRLTIGSRGFRASGADLLYDPNTAVLDDEVVIVDDRLVEFTATMVSDCTGVSIRLVLQDGIHSAAVDNAVITFRN